MRCFQRVLTRSTSETTRGDPQPPSKPLCPPCPTSSAQGVFTLLPLRCALALVQVVRGAVSSRLLRWPRHHRDGASTSAHLGHGPERHPLSFSAGLGMGASRNASFSETPTATPSFATAASAAGGGGHAAAAAAAAASAAMEPRARGHSSRLSGSQLYDMVCLAILFQATAALRAVRPGSIYYWLKDITSEFLKMSVLSTAFDMLDKVGLG
jgi:hypothetical protein